MKYRCPSYPLFFALLCAGVVATAQVIYLPAQHEVYDFLQRMEARGLLADYRDGMKPLSRKVIAAYMKRLESRAAEMTTVERETYEFLKTEFAYELLMLAGDSEPTEIRGHVLSFRLLDGIMNVDVIGKYSYGRNGADALRVQRNGVRLYGYVFENVGYYFNFVDNREVGKNRNITKAHTPEPGIVLTRSTSNWMDYNSTDAQFTYQAGAFELSIEKMQNVWGSGRRGNVILSTKAPSYPQIKLRVPLAEWMEFVYFHADLNSHVLDSLRSYNAGSSTRTNFFRPVYRQKYLAAHAFEMTPLRGIDLMIGESIVYSDKNPQLIYLIPVMFFKSGEHYNRDTDNAQLFGNIDVTLIPRLDLYATLFIDEINTDALLNPNESRNQLGYTVGLQAYDVPLENIELLVEYSRLNPWVYSHKFPAATFTNNDYDLGHWIGQNADNLYAEVRYTPLRALRTGLFYERYRKGGRDDVSFQYTIPSKPFLYPPVRHEKSVGMFARYQFMREGFLDLRARKVTVSGEAPPALNKNNVSEFSIGISYGIW